MKNYLVTSESVSKGHPDKVCDQISDAILDSYITKDRFSRVAVECMVSKGALFIAGEVTSSAKVDIDTVAKKVIKEIGYTDEVKGFDYSKCLIIKNIHTQSPDIDMGVSKNKEIGAGDQGIMYGFACNESKEYLPLTASLSSKLCERMDELKKTGKYPWLYPDGKAQVTMLYDMNDKPKEIKSIVVSTQHADTVDYLTIKSTILSEVIAYVIPKELITTSTKIHINPTGRFVVGGPTGDCGLTGRKIMVDTYGGVAKHGGGAFSGKDPTKVDRSAAYMARYIAKNVVAASLATKCEVALAYAIGMTQPEAITVDTFGTEIVDLEIINKVVRRCFSFSVADIIENLNLRQPIFQKTAVYGHFGRNENYFKWEQIDKAEQLQTEAIKEQILKLEYT